MSIGPTTLWERFCRAKRAAAIAILSGLVSFATMAATPPNQDFLVHGWDLDEGLPSTCVTTVVRTPDGYVWLGTRHGLARFDGLHFTIFNTASQPALRDDRISCLATNAQGTLWIGTDIGTLTKYADGVFTDVDAQPATHGARISGMVADADGTLWLGTFGAGIIRLNVSHAANVVTNLLPSTSIWQLLADPTGGHWYVADPGVLGRIGWDSSLLPQTVALPLPPIHAIALARNGGLWLATQKDLNAGTRIFKWQEGQVTEPVPAYPWPQNSWRSRPGALLEDHAGNLWCGTLGAGVYFQASGGPWQKLSTDPAFSQAETLCLTEDEASSIWIGTRTSGLYQSVLQPLTALMLPDANPQNVILTVCVRRDGTVWAGTDGDGVFRWEDSATNRFGARQGLAGLQVNSLLEDSRGNLWAATSYGLFHYQNGQFTLTTNAASPGPVNALYESPRGNVWAGSTAGLVCLNSPGQKNFGPQSGLPAGVIQDILETPDGILWVAVRSEGVYRQIGGHFVNWVPQQGTMEDQHRWGKGGNVRSLVPDADGSLWIATHGDGLFHLSGDAVRNWNWENDGLPSNHQFALLPDRSGNLWFNCENGIVGYARTALLDYHAGQPPPVPWRLTRADGLPNKVCSGGGSPIAARSADGRLWFPDGPAVAVFDPASVPRRNTHTWPPIIEEVRVDGHVEPVAPNRPLRILSGVRSLEIYFTSPNVLSPTHLHFRYQMTGLDKEWIDAGARRSAQYSGLPPGDYAFRVMVSDDHRIWNTQDARLSLTVIPHFWETTWFQLGVGLGLLASVGLAVRQVERNRSRRKLVVLERERALERERSRIARDIHDDLGASLTEVALLGEMAGDGFGNPDELREQTRKISTAAREMSQSLEAIVWAVRPENDSLQSLVEYMGRRTDELFEKMPRQYQFAVPSELPDCSLHAEVRHNVFLAYKEALTNSLKHARSSLVRIELACDSSECRIMIADNGQGFATGIIRSGATGLKNMRHRMEEIGGRFELVSHPGHGTTVRLHFPLPG